jgi:PKD repeat protein
MTHKLLIFLLMLCLLVGAAAAVPPRPCEFYGTLTQGGQQAPAGSTIVAYYHGTPHGQLVTTQQGFYGSADPFSPRLKVTLTEEEINDCCSSCGCVLSIEFYINGYKADQTAIFQSGNTIYLPLTASGAPTPTITPTTTVTTATPTPTTTTTTATPTPTTATTTATPTTTTTTTIPTTTTPTPTTTATTVIPTPVPSTIPVRPHEFYGTAVLLNDQPVPLGTGIEAFVAGGLTNVQGNPVIVSVAGHYGGDDSFSQRLEVMGTIQENAPISFYIGGVRAEVYDVNASSGWQSTYPFHSAGLTELNLRTNMTMPQAEFTATPLSGYEPLRVYFYDMSTGSPTHWEWNFGDNSANSTLQNPMHSYYNGAYTVTLTVSNAAGTSTTSKVGYIVISKSSSPAAGGGGGGGGGFYAPASTETATPTPTTTPTVTTTPVGPAGGTLPLNVDYRLSQSVVIVAEDNIAQLYLPEGMKPTNATGSPVFSITITRIPGQDVPPVPPGAPYTFAGFAYDIEPSGASFDPYITLSITVPEQEWAAVQGGDLSIKWYNEATGQWEDLPTTVNTNSRTVSATITHTTTFALFVQGGQTPVPTTVMTTVIPTTPAVSSDLTDLLIKVIIIVIIIIAAGVMVIYFLRKRGTEGGAPKPKKEPGTEGGAPGQKKEKKKFQWKKKKEEEEPEEDWEIKGLQ